MSSAVFIIAFRQENRAVVKQTIALDGLVPVSSNHKGFGCRIMEPLEADKDDSNEMPTLTRLIFILAVLAGLVYAGMIALVTFVHPTQTEMTIRIPAEKLNPKPGTPN